MPPTVRRGRPYAAWNDRFDRPIRKPSTVVVTGAVSGRPLVVIPAYNEEESLPAVLKELAEQTPDYDVLVVSDGSTDRTVEVSPSPGWIMS